MSAEILERNVRLLLRRSYVPALPAPPFRDRLESLFLSEVQRRVRASRPARAGTLRRFPLPLRTVAALAAGLLALLVGWRLLAGGPDDARARLLARGEVALGFADGGWRAADEEERVHGLAFVPPALLVVTPAGAGLDVLIGAPLDGRVHVDERSELNLAERGAEIVATLRTGSAGYEHGNARDALVPGVARTLRASEPVLAPALASASGAAAREAAEPTRRTETAPAAPARALAGRVVAAADGTPVRAFTVALLSEWRGNEFPPPVVREFASDEGAFHWPDPPSGPLRVFVHAPGFAMCALGEHDFDRELPALRAELVPGVSVRGSVLDAEGNPVPDALVISENEAPIDGFLFSLSASVQAYWMPIQTRTGPDGRFELAHLNPGKHTLCAGADGFAPTWKESVSAPHASGTELVFTLGPGGIVEGSVTRDDGGPWADAELVVVAMDQVGRARMSFDHTVTDVSGRYRFEHLPEQTMIVVRLRSDSGLDPEVSPVQVIEGETVVRNFGTPRGGLHLHGRAVAGDGTPLALQNLGLFDADSANWNQDWVATTTRADGGYEFQGVQPGRYLFYLIDDIGRSLRCVDEIVVAPGEVALEHEVRSPTGRLAITVYDARNAEPVPQAVLILMRVEGDRRTSFSAFGLSGAGGEVHFSDLRPGSYRVYAYPTGNGLGFTSSDVQVDAREPAALEVVLEEGGPVDVVVRDPEGRPLENAAVVFVDEAGEEHMFSRLPMTDAAGRYRAQGVRPGRYRVSAHLAGRQGEPVEFRFELGHELEVPVVLAPTPR